jgi:wyosine [tRNA(Phe)-imidazoG37] synthetase (radical SAM superfamily)
VPSRRLGQSLGIDTIPPKTCNWNCVYCQLGRSKPLHNERKDYYPLSDMISEIKGALGSIKPEEVDWISFVGSGEPTLHAGIGWLIKEVKKLTDIPVAVITNGSLLFLQSVRKALAAADAVLPSLDAGTPELYKKINRPHPDVPFNRFLDGLIAFQHEFKGHFWLEVMLVKDLNDTQEALTDIAKAIAEIKPDKVHIGVPTRPPAERWVMPPSEEGIMRATAILGEKTNVIHPQEGHFDLSRNDNVVEAIIGIITRHPISEYQLLRAIASFPDEERTKIIDALQTSNQAQVVERFGQKFWCTTSSFFPDTRNTQNSFRVDDS